MNATLLLLLGLIVGYLIGQTRRSIEDEERGFSDGRKFQQKATDAWWLMHLRKRGLDAAAEEIYLADFVERDDHPKR